MSRDAHTFAMFRASAHGAIFLASEIAAYFLGAGLFARQNRRIGPSWSPYLPTSSVKHAGRVTDQQHA